METVDKLVGRDILLFIFQGNESYTQFIQLAVCLEPLVPVFELVQIFFVEAFRPFEGEFVFSLLFLTFCPVRSFFRKEIVNPLSVVLK